MYGAGRTLVSQTDTEIAATLFDALYDVDNHSSVRQSYPSLHAKVQALPYFLPDLSDTAPIQL